MGVVTLVLFERRNLQPEELGDVQKEDADVPEVMPQEL